jgi:hypothetical protein
MSSPINEAKNTLVEKHFNIINPIHVTGSRNKYTGLINPISEIRRLPTKAGSTAFLSRYMPRNSIRQIKKTVSAKCDKHNKWLSFHAEINKAKKKTGKKVFILMMEYLLLICMINNILKTVIKKITSVNHKALGCKTLMIADE